MIGLLVAVGSWAVTKSPASLKKQRRMLVGDQQQQQQRSRDRNNVWGWVYRPSETFQRRRFDGFVAFSKAFLPAGASPFHTMQ